MERERGEKKQTRKRSIVESKEERKKERKIEEERERRNACSFLPIEDILNPKECLEKQSLEE